MFDFLSYAELKSTVNACSDFLKHDKSRMKIDYKCVVTRYPHFLSLFQIQNSNNSRQVAKSSAKPD